MLLHDKLRNQTSAIHCQIERTNALKKITDNDVTLGDHRKIIMMFYGFIAPCETLLSRFAKDAILVNRSKSQLLEADLLALGFDQADMMTIHRCDTLPEINNHLQMLGYLYVMEGSTLGGKIIAQHLKDKLHLSNSNGAAYFSCYGKDTKKMWLDFCNYLNLIEDSVQQDTVIHSAELTFQSLYRWLNDYEGK